MKQTEEREKMRQRCFHNQIVEEYSLSISPSLSHYFFCLLLHKSVHGNVCECLNAFKTSLFVLFSNTKSKKETKLALALFVARLTENKKRKNIKDESENEKEEKPAQKKNKNEKEKMSKKTRKKRGRKKFNNVNGERENKRESEIV